MKWGVGTQQRSEAKDKATLKYTHRGMMNKVNQECPQQVNQSKGWETKGKIILKCIQPVIHKEVINKVNQWCPHQMNQKWGKGARDRVRPKCIHWGIRKKVKDK